MQLQLPSYAIAWISFVCATIIIYVIISIYRKKISKHLLENISNYSRNDIRSALENYIQTYFQYSTPSDADEIGFNKENIKRQRLIKFLYQKLYFSKKGHNKYFLILGDTGMGKTTFLINTFSFFKHHHPWFIKNKLTVKLVSLGAPNWTIDLEQTACKNQTILLLDALDEDDEARNNYKKRETQLINLTKDFYAIIITCRTQFFSSKSEEPDRTNDFSFGETGFHRFNVYYISPLTLREARHYIYRKYPFYKSGSYSKQKQAFKILQECRYLLMRPMLLSHIDDLLETNINYNYSYKLYELFINKWISRESNKYGILQKYGSVKRYEKLLNMFSQKLAYRLYELRNINNGYSIHVSTDFENSGFSLQDYDSDYGKIENSEIQSKSLLNRTTDGFYKFSHRSICEYFIAKEIFEKSNLDELKNVTESDNIRNFTIEMLCEPVLKKIHGFYFDKNGLKISFAEFTPTISNSIYGIEISEPNKLRLSLLHVFKNLNYCHIYFNEYPLIYEAYNWFIQKLNSYNELPEWTLYEKNESSLVIAEVNEVKINLKNQMGIALENWLNSIAEGAHLLKSYEIEGRNPTFSNYSTILLNILEEQKQLWKIRSTLIQNNYVPQKESLKLAQLINPKSAEKLNPLFENLENWKTQNSQIKLTF